LLKLAGTFPEPFASERRVRERLRALAAERRVRRWRYATAGPGAAVYYTLSAAGYRLLHGHDAAVPSRRAFAAVPVARQRHTAALADFLVHTPVAAHAVGPAVTDFRRENGPQFSAGEDCLYPDAAFSNLYSQSPPADRTFDPCPRFIVPSPRHVGYHRGECARLL